MCLIAVAIMVRNHSNLIYVICLCSCDSAIERLWSASKSHYKKLLLLHKDRELSFSEFKELVVKALEMVSPEAINGIIKSNRAYIRNKLEEIVKIDSN